MPATRRDSLRRCGMGKPLPTASLLTERKTGNVFPSPFKFQKYGQSGIEVSGLFPRVGACVDDIAVIRSMQAAVPKHEPSRMLMNCGDAVMNRPSVADPAPKTINCRPKNTEIDKLI